MTRAPAAFPANSDRGVVGDLAGANERRAFSKTKMGARADEDRTNEVVARGNENFSIRVSAGVECRLERGRIFGRAVASGTEAANIEDGCGRSVVGAAGEEDENKRGEEGF